MSLARIGLSSLRQQHGVAAVRNSVFRRFASTGRPQIEIVKDGRTILNNQRLLRPSSPHFTIYQPQLTWIGSIANRVTGVGLSVLLYGFSLGYLFAPSTFSSSSIIETVAALPDAVKTAGKVILAAPFAFHSLNGVRHLSWDLVKFITVKGAYQSGYAVLGATAIATVVLVFQ